MRIALALHRTRVMLRQPYSPATIHLFMFYYCMQFWQRSRGVQAGGLGWWSHYSRDFMVVGGLQTLMHGHSCHDQEQLLKIY